MYLRTLYSQLAHQGADAELLGIVPRWEATGLAAFDLQLGEKWSRRSAWRALRSLQAERRRAMTVIRQRHRERPFDLFHAQYKREQILLTRKLSDLAPVIWTEHGRFPDGRATLPLRMAYRRASKHVFKIICVSPDVEADVRAVCGLGTPTIVIPNGVDTEYFAPPTAEQRRQARASLGVPPLDLCVATVSRLHRAKRIDLGILALDHLPGAVIVVAGAGDDAERLRPIAEGRSVIFTGPLLDPRPVFKAADVFLILSSAAAREGLPFSLLEAAASGLRLVAARGSGVDAVVEGIGGTVTEPEPAAVARAILSAMHNHQGSAARDWAVHNDVRAVTEAHRRAMLGAVEARARRA